MLSRIHGFGLTVIAGLSLTATLGHADPLDDASRIAEKTNLRAAESQRRINKLDDQTRALLEKYRAATWESQQMQLYVEQLTGQVDSQQRKIDSLKEQIASVAVTKRELLPLMTNMIDTLESFIKLDLPFDRDKRLTEITKLRGSMLDAETSVPERLRHILDAYKQERSYSRSLDATQLELDIDRESKVVDVLRVGRVGLFYLSLDGEHLGYWDRESKQWETLGNEHRAAIRKGLKIANDRQAPDLLDLPLPAPVAAERQDDIVRVGGARP